MERRSEDEAFSFPALLFGGMGKINLPGNTRLLGDGGF